MATILEEFNRMTEDEKVTYLMRYSDLDEAPQGEPIIADPIEAREHAQTEQTAAKKLFGQLPPTEQLKLFNKMQPPKREQFLNNLDSKDIANILLTNATDPTGKIDPDKMLQDFKSIQDPQKQKEVLNELIKTNPELAKELFQKLTLAEQKKILNSPNQNLQNQLATPATAPMMPQNSMMGPADQNEAEQKKVLGTLAVGAGLMGVGKLLTLGGLAFPPLAIAGIVMMVIGALVTAMAMLFMAHKIANPSPSNAQNNTQTLSQPNALSPQANNVNLSPTAQNQSSANETTLKAQLLASFPQNHPGGKEALRDLVKHDPDVAKQVMRELQTANPQKYAEYHKHLQDLHHKFARELPQPIPAELQQTQKATSLATAALAQPATIAEPPSTTNAAAQKASVDSARLPSSSLRSMAGSGENQSKDDRKLTDAHVAKPSPTGGR